MARKGNSRVLFGRNASCFAANSAPRRGHQPDCFPCFLPYAARFASGDFRTPPRFARSRLCIISDTVGHIERRSGDGVRHPGAEMGVCEVPLEVLTLMMPLRMVSVFIPNALQGIGRADLLFYNNLVAAVVMPIAFFIGIQWGLEGLSLAWMFITPLVFLENMRRTLPPLGLRVIDLWKALAPSGVAAVAMYSAVAGARWLLPPHFVALGAMLTRCDRRDSYVLGSFVFNRRGSLELIRLLRSATLPAPHRARHERDNARPVLESCAQREIQDDFSSVRLVLDRRRVALGALLRMRYD